MCETVRHIYNTIFTATPAFFEIMILDTRVKLFHCQYCVPIQDGKHHELRTIELSRHKTTQNSNSLLKGPDGTKTVVK